MKYPTNSEAALFAKITFQELNPAYQSYLHFLIKERLGTGLTSTNANKLIATCLYKAGDHATTIARGYGWAMAKTEHLAMLPVENTRFTAYIQQIIWEDNVTNNRGLTDHELLQQCNSKYLPTTSNTTTAQALSNPATTAILDAVIIPDTLMTNEYYARVQDDCDGDKSMEHAVRIIMDAQGDVHIGGDKRLLRFRTYAGGGASLRVRNALLLLAEAIRLDNEE